MALLADFYLSSLLASVIRWLQNPKMTLEEFWILWWEPFSLNLIPHNLIVAAGSQRKHQQINQQKHQCRNRNA